jgi:predicted DNA-binding transcriptional regulator YafY
VRVHVRAADATIVEVLRFMFGNRVEAGQEGPDGKVDVALRANSELMLARQLAGFGDRIEVVSPEILREHLADIGRGLLRAHA